MRFASWLALAGVLAGTSAVADCSSNTTIGSGGAGASGSGHTTSGGGHTTTTSRSATTTTTATSTSGGGTTTASTTASTTTSTGGPVDSGIANPCQLPGSVQFTTNGKTTVPGGNPSWPDLTFLTLPSGFCAHYFGTVGNARQIRFAPGGELFVASPTGLTTGGNGNAGQASILVLPDDDKDGVADANLTFINFGASTAQWMNQGILFTPGFFYYQDGTPPGTLIMRMPYNVGDRKPSGTAAQVANINGYTSPLHWPKTMDVADDGTIYVGNGGDQGEQCVEPHPFHGGIFKIDPAPGGPNPNGVPIAKGFRNPIAVRCARGHDQCFALELALDYSYNSGGREKMVPIHQGDDWGFPCCATANLPYQGSPVGTDCSGVAQETNGFYIGDTPFGVDFEPGVWPSMWANRAYVVTHGAAGSWTGARMVSIPMDATTGLPLPSTNANASHTDMGMVDFATGWDDNTLQHGRPASVSFSTDGRLFVANDNDGVIFWIAPM